MVDGGSPFIWGLASVVGLGVIGGAVYCSLTMGAAKKNKMKKRESSKSCNTSENPLHSPSSPFESPRKSLHGDNHKGPLSKSGSRSFKMTENPLPLSTSRSQ